MSEFPAAAFRLDGDPSAIRGSAGSYAAFGAQAADAAEQIRSLDTSLFIGPEGDLYRQGLKKSLPPHLDVTGEAYSLVASALNGFADALSGLQDRMAPLAVRAPGLWEDLQTAQGSLAAAQAADRVHAQLRAAEAAAANPSHTVPPDTYVTEAGAARGALSAAEQAWNDCLAAAGQVKADLHTAIDACASTIRRASGMRFKRNPHGLGAVWSGVTHFVKDHITDLAGLSGVLKSISFVSGMLSFIPVIGEVALAVSIVAGATALALDATQMAFTGKWNAVILAEDGIALLPVAGKFTGEAVRGVRSARAAAAEAKTAEEVGSRVDITAAGFAQKSYREAFSRGGLFEGKTIDDVAGELSSRALLPKDVPVNVVVREGNTLILNTRSAQALTRAGIPRESWNVINRTGDDLYESLLSGQLSRNGLTSSGYEFPR